MKLYEIEEIREVPGGRRQEGMKYGNSGGKNERRRKE
jgi:hypothetical protein